MKRQTLGIVFLLLTLAVASLASAAPISDDRTYLFAAARYLNIQKEQGKRVKQAIAGLGDRTINDADVRRALEAALAVTNEDWNANYLTAIKSHAPTAYADLDKDIQHSHELREAAYRDWLQNSKGDFIEQESANASFGNSLEAEDQAMAKLIEALSQGK